MRLDQRTEVGLDLRPPSPWARLLTPITAKSGPMPSHERLRLDNCDDLQNRWKPAIQLDKEPAVAVREPDPALHLTPQVFGAHKGRCRDVETSDRGTFPEMQTRNVGHAAS